MYSQMKLLEPTTKYETLRDYYVCSLVSEDD